MAGSSSKGGDHFWPGFVDALTNVVIAMVFVIVVLAIALSFSAQLLAQRMAARIAALEQQGRATKAVDAPPASEPRPPSAGAQAAPPDARVPVTERIAVRGTEREHSPPQGVALRPAARRLVLDYEPGALTLDSAATQRLAGALPPFKSALQQAGDRVVIVARGPSMDLSENQRAGFIRVMAVRNVLLEQGIDRARIDTRIDVRTRAERNTVDVLLEKQP